LTRKFNGRRSHKPFVIIQRSRGDLTGFQLRSPQKWAGAINQIIGAPAAVVEAPTGYELQAG
jgi:hypothetical protein